MVKCTSSEAGRDLAIHRWRNTRSTETRLKRLKHKRKLIKNADNPHIQQMRKKETGKLIKHHVKKYDKHKRRMNHQKAAKVFVNIKKDKLKKAKQAEAESDLREMLEARGVRQFLPRKAKVGGIRGGVK